MTQRYLIFAGDCYYPIGGWCDYFASYENLENAKSSGIHRMLSVDWFHIVDMVTGKICFRGTKHLRANVTEIHTVTIDYDGIETKELVTL